MGERAFGTPLEGYPPFAGIRANFPSCPPLSLRTSTVWSAPQNFFIVAPPPRCSGPQPTPPGFVTYHMSAESDGTYYNTWTTNDDNDVNRDLIDWNEKTGWATYLPGNPSFCPGYVPIAGDDCNNANPNTRCKQGLACVNGKCKLAMGNELNWVVQPGMPPAVLNNVNFCINQNNNNGGGGNNNACEFNVRPLVEQWVASVNINATARVSACRDRPGEQQLQCFTQLMNEIAMYKQMVANFYCAGDGSDPRCAQGNDTLEKWRTYVQKLIDILNGGGCQAGPACPAA